MKKIRIGISFKRPEVASGENRARKYSGLKLANSHKIDEIAEWIKSEGLGGELFEISPPMAVPMCFMQCTENLKESLKECPHVTYVFDDLPLEVEVLNE